MYMYSEYDEADVLWNFDETRATSFNSPNSLQDKTDHLNNILRKHNYNADLVRWNTHSNAIQHSD